MEAWIEWSIHSECEVEEGGREGEEKVKMGGKGVILDQPFLRIWVCCFFRFRLSIQGEILTFGFYTFFYPSIHHGPARVFFRIQISCF